jgi:hypothetical protein
VSLTNCAMQAHAAVESSAVLKAHATLEHLPGTHAAVPVAAGQ